MLGSNWRKDLEFGLIVTACALILALPIGGLLLAEYAKVHGTNAAYQQNAERDRKATSEEISKTCFKSDFIAFSTCINEKVAAYYKQQATNQDLKAQQDMAYWAKALLFLGLIQLGFSGAGIILVLRSLELTRIATNAAVESNRDNREIGEAQVRSYVTIESCKFDFINTTPGNIGVLDIGYSNTGQSPAFNFMVELGLRMIRTGNPNFLATGIAPEQHHCQIPSRVVTTVSRDFKGSFPIGVPKSSFPSEWLEHISKGQVAILLDGAIKWTDVFDKTHHVKIWGSESIQRDYSIERPPVGQFIVSNMGEDWASAG